MEEKQRANRIRKRRMEFYLLEEEYELLELKAHEAGLSKSALLRNLILYGAAHRRTLFSAEDTEKIKYEINRIGNNINQIAYWANTLKQVDREKLDAIMRDYDELLGEFERVIME